jgi:hypothetical protein
MVPVCSDFSGVLIRNVALHKPTRQIDTLYDRGLNNTLWMATLMVTLIPSQQHILYLAMNPGGK